MKKAKLKEDILSLNIDDVYSVTVCERTDESISWFIIAQENLLTAKILLQNHRIPHSIYFLQQCVECIQKGILVENHLIDVVKNAGHFPEEVFEEFYKHYSEMSNQNCSYIHDKLKGAETFEKKMIVIANIVNAFTEKFKDLGLDGKLQINIQDRQILNKLYVDTILFCFAKLFSSTQQNSRYPEFSNGITLPNKLYNNEAVIQGVTTMIPLIEYCLKCIMAGDKDYK